MSWSYCRMALGNQVLTFSFKKNGVEDLSDVRPTRDVFL